MANNSLEGLRDSYDDFLRNEVRTVLHGLIVKMVTSTAGLG